MLGDRDDEQIVRSCTFLYVKNITALRAVSAITKRRVEGPQKV